MRTIKQFLQAILARLGLHQRLKASFVYDLYWSIADRRRIDARGREVDFYRGLLHGFRQGDLIFDIGANDGTKTDVFLRLGALVVAVEPDERNQEILRGKFLKYRLARKPVIIVGKAVSDRNTIETMWIDGPGSALNTFSQKWVQTLRSDEKRLAHSLDRLEFAQRKEVETTTLEDLVTAHGLPFFVKIDVEGYELNVLRGMQRLVPYLSFEVNLPEFREEGLQCVELLAHLAADGKFNYAANNGDELVLAQWLDAREFSRVLEQCADESVEVFWESRVSIGR
jgi:FkbM family methyltransferase